MAEKQINQGKTYHRKIKSVLGEVAAVAAQSTLHLSPTSPVATTFSALTTVSDIEGPGTVFLPFGATAEIFEGISRIIRRAAPDLARAVA